MLPYSRHASCCTGLVMGSNTGMFGVHGRGPGVSCNSTALRQLACVQGKLIRLPVGVMVCDQGLPAQQAAMLIAAGILSSSSESSVLSQVLLDSSIFNSSSPASQTLKWTAVLCTCSADATGAGCISSMQDSLMNIGDYWAMLYVPHSFSASLMGWMTAAANSTAVRPTMTYMFPQVRLPAWQVYAGVLTVCCGCGCQVLPSVVQGVFVAQSSTCSCVQPLCLREACAYVVCCMRCCAISGTH